MIVLLHHIGMVLLGGVFVWAGAEHFLKFRAIAAALRATGFPVAGPLLAAGSVLEIVAGACLAAGIFRPFAAASLALFTVTASVMVLNFWRHSGEQRQALRSSFTINIAVLGALVAVATSNPP